MAAVIAQERRIAVELPSVDLREVASVTELGKMMMRASVEVFRHGAVKSDAPAMLAEGRPLRDLMLASGTSLALKGLMPAAEIEPALNMVGR